MALKDGCKNRSVVPTIMSLHYIKACIRAVSYTHLDVYKRQALLAQPGIYSQVVQKLMSEQFLSCQILSKRHFPHSGLIHYLSLIHI